MNDTDLARLVCEALYAVAPDLENETLDPQQRFRDQFEFDSMDFNRYIVELHRRTGLDIPERVYSRLETIDGAVEYLKAAGLDPS